MPERVKVRHILIKTQGKPKEEAPKLKAKAEDILKQLQHGADFAQLAKQNSEDPGSAVKGGELGWIVKGQTVPNFEKTAFSLKPGELSGVVETEYGYHIIQVEEKQTAHTQSFEEVKPQLLADAQKQAGADDLKKAMDAAHDEIAQHPSQAEAIAKKYNLKFFKLSNVASGQPLPEVNNPPELTNAIFAAPKGSVTDVADLSNQGKVGIRRDYERDSSAQCRVRGSGERRSAAIHDRRISSPLAGCCKECGRSRSQRGKPGSDRERIRADSENRRAIHD